jgi:Rrf2 family transcriptional regulator, iron-sulfur cluster assembly transcription factor
MITREADYAIRVVLYLARRGPEAGPVTSGDVAEGMLIPYRFLRRIVQRLVAAGIVVTQRGKRGGIALARANAELSLLDVLRAADPRSLQFNVCLEQRSRCALSPDCPVRVELHRVQSVLHTHLEELTFDQLV